MNTIKKVAITGCGGMLGEAVFGVFSKSYEVYASDIDLNESWLSKLDVRSSKDVHASFSERKPDAIVHLAALTDMELCEGDAANAYATNAQGTVNALRFASQAGIPFVYISTAGVFDGEKDAYDEGDVPNPLSIYGKSKYVGEAAAMAYPKSIIVRAGWMMGGGPEKDKKFVNKIIKQLCAGTTELNVVSDKLGTPCYTYDLAKTLEFLLRAQAYGIYHGACEGGASRLEVAEHIVSELGLKDRVTVHEVDSSHFTKEYFAPRPRSEQLVNTRLKQLDPALTRDWKVCLTEYLQKFTWL